MRITELRRQAYIELLAATDAFHAAPPSVARPRFRVSRWREETEQYAAAKQRVDEARYFIALSDPDPAVRRAAFSLYKAARPGNRVWGEKYEATRGRFLALARGSLALENPLAGLD